MIEDEDEKLESEYSQKSELNKSSIYTNNDQEVLDRLEKAASQLDLPETLNPESRFDSSPEGIKTISKEEALARQDKHKKEVQERYKKMRRRTEEKKRQDKE